jgi:hypothetical protein
MKTQKTVKRSPGKKRKLFENVLSNDDLEIDPSYKLFLENLSIDGNTYLLDLPNGDHGMSVSVRYEDTSCNNVMDKDATDVTNSSLSRSLGALKTKRTGEASGRAPTGNVGHSFLPQTSGKGCIHKTKNGQTLPRTMRKRELRAPDCPFSSPAKRKMETSAMDESYELFLSLVKFKDGFMVIEPEPGVTIVYEQELDMPARYNELRAGRSTKGPKPLISPTENMEENAISASGLVQADKIASEDEMARPSSKELDGQDIICKNYHGRDSLTFDEKLNAILNQPYDQNEYEELWKRATDRKPVSRQRHLRSASKRYVTKATGLSYLDHYPGNY